MLRRFTGCAGLGPPGTAIAVEYWVRDYVYVYYVYYYFTTGMHHRGLTGLHLVLGLQVDCQLQPQGFGGVLPEEALGRRLGRGVSPALHLALAHLPTGCLRQLSPCMSEGPIGGLTVAYRRTAVHNPRPAILAHLDYCRNNAGTV